MALFALTFADINLLAFRLFKLAKHNVLDTVELRQQTQFIGAASAKIAAYHARCPFPEDALMNFVLDGVKVILRDVLRTVQKILKSSVVKNTIKADRDRATIRTLSGRLDQCLQNMQLALLVDVQLNISTVNITAEAESPSESAAIATTDDVDPDTKDSVQGSTRWWQLSTFGKTTPESTCVETWESTLVETRVQAIPEYRRSGWLGYWSGFSTTLKIYNTSDKDLVVWLSQSEIKRKGQVEVAGRVNFLSNDFKASILSEWECVEGGRLNSN